jgi:hypothetical protein
MERRLENRWSCDFEAKLTGLKNGDTGPGRITNISKSGIGILSSLRFEQGDVVQVDLADNKMFGHIAYCHADADSYRTGIEIVQVLVGGPQLSRLLETILRESLPTILKPAPPSEIHLG